MTAAEKYYGDRGWAVNPVYRTKKVLDLRITDPVSGEVRYVEVKGSSGVARRVEVTAAEVAMSRRTDCELFVLDKIRCKATGEDPGDYACEGGRPRVGRWRADDEDLTPKTYDYRLPPGFGRADASLAAAGTPGPFEAARMRWVTVYW